jgi:integrase/recombinase XerD
MATSQASWKGLLDEYVTFLRHHRGLRDSTLYYHRRWGGAFLRHLLERLPDEDFGSLTISVIDEFVRPRVRVAGRGTQSQLIQAVRGVLRHLHRTGRVARDWSPFTQGPRKYRLASLPATIRPDEVQRLLASVNRRSSMGRRSYAVLLLLAVYGLRAREVAGLRLGDVDWRASVLRVQRSKTGRSLTLPLTAAVGQALVTYLRRGRPHTEAREIFVRHDSRPVAFKSSTVYSIVRRAFDRAQIRSVHRGPHVLRHALATELVRRGFALKVVGDLLGHQHPDSTLPYAKLAIDDLREVALEVPEFGQ